MFRLAVDPTIARAHSLETALDGLTLGHLRTFGQSPSSPA